MCIRLSNEVNEWVVEWGRISKGREKEERDSSQPETCAHPIIKSIDWKQTYREVSVVTASKNSAGSAWRESTIDLRVVFESNIHTYIHRLSLAWSTQSTCVISFLKSPPCPFFFFQINFKFSIFSSHSQTVAYTMKPCHSFCCICFLGPFSLIAEKTRYKSPYARTLAVLETIQLWIDFNTDPWAFFLVQNAWN